MTLREAPRTPRGDLIDGQWVRPTKPDGVIEAVSPADLDDHIGDWPFAVAHARNAIGAASAARPDWRRLDPARRASYLRAYAKALTKRKDALVVAISRAIGKPLWESRTEVDAMIAKVDITLSAGVELVKTQLLPELGAVIRYRPLGVCVVIGPFNFPGHLANGHIVPALALGNVVIFKPSERAPEVGDLMAECFLEAGFPPGVIQMVHGAAEVSKELLASADVDAVMFTGSTAVGSSILAQSAGFPGRMVALEMGGKNSAIVLSDADLNHAAREIAFAAFVTAGQRCTGTSRVLVERPVADKLIEMLSVSARETRVGLPDADDVFLGPVIADATRQRLASALVQGSADYDEIVPARPLEVAGVRGYYLSPGLYVRRPRASKPTLDREELFAPLVTIEVVDNEADAIAGANGTRYGLAACVFTSSRDRFERMAPEIDVGICNWNRGTVGSSSKLPFGGVRDSGNHRAAGLYSSFYCVDPVAELHVAQPSPAALAPGLRIGTA